MNFKKVLIGFILILIIFVSFSQNLMARSKYDWDKFEEKYNRFIEKNNASYDKEFLEFLPKRKLSSKEISHGKEEIDLIFSPDNFSKLKEKAVQQGDVRMFSILFRLKYLTDGAYSTHLFILTGSLIRKFPKQFLLAVDKNFEHIKRLDAILGNLGTEYVDELKKQYVELKKRYNALEEVEIKSSLEPVKQLCLCKLKYRMQNIKQKNTLAHNKKYEEYTGDHIRLSYPEAWNKQVDEYGNFNKIIYFKEKNEILKLMIEMRGRTNKENKKMFLKKLFEKAKKLKFGKVIYYEEIDIDNKEGKNLVFEFNIIEQLYNELKKIKTCNKLEEYINQYGDVRDFISDIKNDSDKLKELKAIFHSIQNKESSIDLNDEKIALINRIEGLTDRIDYNLRKDKAFKYMSKSIVVYKENFKLRISFYGRKDIYNNKIKTMEKVINSIEFID
ncbi:hypothetical protein [Sporohalobacter salinus]|uniref:hypothetical protein n=1 Tax=Sporohalobacter salinus TaxID=1494606 RepID=UPI00195FB930|nr:hypothetical protein [Sporohalobacter salinus]MBM7624257.1 hypothetical protein [Sporohalobacter salinus]